MEDNILVAKFLDFDVFSSGACQYQSEVLTSLPEFDIDWNWIMKVVDKINTFEKGIFGVTITGNKTTVEDCYGLNRNCCFECDDYNTIKNTYFACVEFIKWYNNQKNNHE